MKKSLRNITNILLVILVVSLTPKFVLADISKNWTLNGYGHLKQDLFESLSQASTYQHRRDYRAAGPAFSANPNQIEMTLTKMDKYENGAWAKYVLKTEYGNNEGGNGTPFYGSSSGNEGHLESGQLEFKEGYIELGNLSYFKKGTSIWAGRRYLNRQIGIITKEFWRQSAGVGAGIQYNNMGFAIVSVDQGMGYTLNSSNETVSGKFSYVINGKHTTITSFDSYLYGVEALGGKLDFDIKYMRRANITEVRTTNSDAAAEGLAAGISYSTNYYGLDGWSLTAVTYGQGIASTKGLNFGSWNDAWNRKDTSLFVTSYGVLNITSNLQLGSEFVYWGLKNRDDKTVWGTMSVDRYFIGFTPSYKIDDNFRMELVLTYALEKLADGADWGREHANANFITATLSPVFTVNADYWGRPQIKPFLSFLTSNESTYVWSSEKNSGNEEIRAGIEAEISF